MNRLNQHQCKRAKCSRKSDGGGDKRAIPCFGCGDIYYTQCFNLKLDPVKQKGFFQPKSHVQFICASCYEPMSKYISQHQQQQQQQQNNDKAHSTDNSNDKNQALHSSSQSSNSQQTKDTGYLNTSAGTADKTAKDGSAIINDASQDKVLNTMDSILKKMESFEQLFADNRSLVENKSNSIEMHITNTVSQHLLSLHAKYNPSIEQNNEIAKINENCNKLLADFAKMTHLLSKVATVEQLKSSTSNICSSFEKTVKSKPTPANSNVLDWSVLNDSLNADDASNGRQSVVVRQCIDDSIVEMLKNSDSTTWKSFDVLFSKLQEQSDHINNIGDDIRLLTTKIENLSTNDGTSVRSPLMESIFHDTLSDNISKILSEISNLSNNWQDQPTPMSNDVQVQSFEKSNAERLAGISSTNIASAGTQASISSQNSTGNESNVDRSAGQSSHFVASSTRSSIDLLNTTDVFTNSQLMTELNANTANINIDDSTGLNMTAGRTQYPQTSNSSISSVSHSHAVITESQSTDDLSFMNFPPLAENSSEQCNNCNCNIELHLSNVTPNTSVEEIVNFIKSNCDPNMRASQFRVYKLLKKNQDTTNLKYINFKVECCSHLSHILTKNNFWPTHCHIKPFVRKNVGHFAQSPSGNFRIINQQHIQTRSM